MKAYQVNIIGLSNKAHHFTYRLDDAFFEEYGKNVISHGDFQADVTLDKRETFIEASFKIKGKAGLVCDRSLRTFDEPLNIDRKIVFKYGEEEAEVSDEIMIIHRDRDSLELGQYLYEFIVLALPMKKLHPDLRKEEEDDDSESAVNGKMVYSSEAETPKDEIDPRWEKLKKLK